MFLVRKGRQRCRARLIALVLGMDTEFTIEGGINDGQFHLLVSSISAFGKLIIEAVNKYWEGAKKVSFSVISETFIICHYVIIGRNLISN